MDIQKMMRRTLVATLGLSLGTIAACASLSSAPIRGGERCFRCDRVLENRLVAGEVIAQGVSIAYPFRTIRCMLTFLRDTDQPFEHILVTDYVTGRLVPVRQAHVVRVPIDELAGMRRYGIGEFDYVAFRSKAAATRFAERYATSTSDWSTVRAFEAVATPLTVASR